MYTNMADRKHPHVIDTPFAEGLYTYLWGTLYTSTGCLPQGTPYTKREQSALVPAVVHGHFTLVQN